jgi:hypothetical protein
MFFGWFFMRSLLGKAASLMCCGVLPSRVIFTPGRGDVNWRAQIKITGVTWGGAISTGSHAVTVVSGILMIVGLLSVFVFGLRLLDKSQRSRDLLK